MKITRCDFCVYGNSCGASLVEGSPEGYSYAGSEECREAARSFTQYMIARERNRGRQKTYNKNVNIKKR